MKLKITVHGVAYEVDVEVLDGKDEMRGSASPLPPARVEAAPRPEPISPAGPASTPTPSSNRNDIEKTEKNLDKHRPSHGRDADWAI